jgi:hypothetical protein
VPLPPLATPDNLRYLTVKRDRMGHKIGNLGPILTVAPVSGELF